MTDTYQSQRQHPWYAIRTFNCQEQKVSRFLTEKQLSHFIPMTYVQPAPSADDDGESRPRPVLVPAVHNLLFVEKCYPQADMVQLLKECDIPISIFRHPGDQTYCEIPSRDMIDMRMLCDPQFETAVYMSQPEAEAKVGKEVRVTAGPFKGATGRLVRKNKQYYILKSIVGMGVMVRISRWYCEPI